MHQEYSAVDCALDYLVEVGVESRLGHRPKPSLTPNTGYHSLTLFPRGISATKNVADYTKYQWLDLLFIRILPPPGRSQAVLTKHCNLNFTYNLVSTVCEKHGECATFVEKASAIL
jgi:hypothetical protein